MKLLLATSAIGLALAAVAPVTAEADTAPAEAPVWMASVMSLATDDGFALVQDEDEDCDDEEQHGRGDESYTALHPGMTAHSRLPATLLKRRAET